MRKGLWIVAAVALLGSSVAMAQDQGQRRDDRGQNSGRPDAGRPNAGRPDAGRPDSAKPSRPAPRPPVHRPPPRPPVARPPYGRRPPHRFLAGGGWRHSIHGPAFRYPPGFSYRLWTTGAILPGIFLTPQYFYDGYASLGLAPPPLGFQWVRYGPDLLLVNLHTGRVADTVDGVFY
jgi:Ni/Co efflux regulator RcnB